MTTAQQMGWAELENGDLIRAAEGQFEVLITCDKNLGYQQNLKDRTITIVVLPMNRLRLIANYADKLLAVLAVIKPGDYVEIPR